MFLMGLLRNQADDQRRDEGESGGCTNSWTRNRGAIFEKILMIGAGVGQYFFQNNVFICPVKDYTEYALLILITPMLTLFCVSIIMGTNSSKIGNVLKSCYKTRRLRIGRVCHTELVFNFLYYISISLITPMVWLIMCFLRKDIYLCAVVGPLMYNGTKAAQIHLNDHRAASMKWGLGLLQGSVGAVIVIYIVKEVLKHKRKNNANELKIYQRYQKRCAQQFFHQSAKQYIRHSLKNNIENLFSTKDVQQNNNTSSPLDVLENLESIWESMRAEYPGVCLECFDEGKGEDFFDGNAIEYEKESGSSNEEETIKLTLNA
ncbi:uncharacterized protein [Clytia hemisphaerica]